MSVEDGGEGVCCSLVGWLGVVTVDVEGGGGSGVAESAGGGAHVDVVEEHGGCGEVAEIVEPDLGDADLCDETGEREGRVVGPPWAHAVGVVAEDVAVPR